MNPKVLTLSNRVVLSSGEIVFTYSKLLEMARDGTDFHEYLVESDDYILKYNTFTDKKLKIFNENENYELDETKYEWNTPEKYKKVDIYEYCASKLVEYNTSDIYVDRLKEELSIMEERNMMPLLQHLLFLKDHFVKNNAVWGVGRGSSCASLVLFLLEINLIDPIEYNIPLKEFLR